MNYTISKYKMITSENIEQFNDRTIIYNSTQASCLEVENTILTLVNERTFYDSFQGFKNRFRKSKFMQRSQETQATMVYKWLSKFLIDNSSIKEVNYIYVKVNLSHIIEASLLLLEDVLKE